MDCGRVVGSRPRQRSGRCGPGGRGRDPGWEHFAPDTPAGMLIIGANLRVAEGAQGLRHYIPVDPNNVDPVNTGHC